MASGTIQLTSTNSAIAGRISWSSTVNVSNNSSSLTIKYQLRKTDGYTTTGNWVIYDDPWLSGSADIYAAGQIDESINASVSSDWVTLKNITYTVPHDATGNRSVKNWVMIIGPEGTTLSGVNIYSHRDTPDIVLDTIYKTAFITSASNFTDEGSPTVKYSNPAGSKATVAIALCWDKAGTDALISYTTVTGTSGTKTFTLTTAQKNAIYSKMASVKSKTIYYRIRTTVNGDNYVSNVARTVSIVNANPTLSPTAVENTDTDDKDGTMNIAATGSASRWIKGYSDIKYAFNATASKGATIKSYSVKCGSKSGTASTGTLYNIDSGTVKFTVTDSRGNTATKTITGTLIDYINLTCSLSASATLDTDNTAKAAIKVSGNFFDGQIKSGTNNSLTLQYRYKVEGGSYSSWTAVTPTISGSKYSCNYTIPTSFDYQSSVTIQARARDGLHVAYSSYVTSNEVVVKAEPVFDWSKSDFRFNVPLRRNFKTNTSNAISIVDGFNPDGSQRYRIGAHNLGDTDGSIYLIPGTSPEECWRGTKGLYIGSNVLKYNGMKLCENKILWGENRTVGYAMSDNQTVTLSEGVSKQANGIVLVFCHYADENDTNRNYQYFFVPKSVIALTMGTTQVFSLSSLTFNTVGTKVLTFTSDTTITGSAGNLTTGTGNSGITYSNNKFVLRYVIGV